ncbi:unnamed protein product [Paramecium primaurelia]|uniref:non-specific serine/threonine protein kinase n=1 Tax=Paramecium primaurelia TaxID=5886 RepID=A0A8S1MSF6_PARPR|nr:unnamed protein product [Paramecium primaurelia]
MSLKDFKMLSKLGDGAFSSVYKVKRIEDHLEYALKKVNLNNLSEKEKQNALNEVRILASIRHQNIISYKEAFLDPTSNSLCIIMELASDGDLLQKIKKYIKTNSSFKEAEIFRYAFQLLNALKSLHEMKVMHRDIKSANVFMINNEVKLGDMNVSKVAKQGLLYTQTGTPYYASPEVWKDHPYDCKSDIWSLGCVLYEMAALKLPFQAEDMDGLFKKVVKGFYPKLPVTYSFDLQNLIRMMLQVSTALRPTASQLLELPFFQKYKLNTPDSTAQLLNTIQFPKNKSYINIFPKPNYKFKTESTDKNDLEQIHRKRQATLGGNASIFSNPTRLSQYEESNHQPQIPIKQDRLDQIQLKSNRHSLVKLLSDGSLPRSNSKVNTNKILQDKIRKRLPIPNLLDNMSPILCKKSVRVGNDSNSTMLPQIA